MTTAEIKDAAIFVMAYSFLQMDSTEKLGLFINKKASKFIDELIEADIKTLEGTMRANNGDYIIKGVKGEIYPCKP